MNPEDYTVEITRTPKDDEFTQQCLEAGFDLMVISMFRTSLEKLVAAEREACAKVCDEMAENDKLSNYYRVAALAIRERGAP